MSSEGVFQALRRRKYPRWLIGYAAAAWGAAEATGFLIDNYGAPRRLLDVVLFLVLICLFLVIVVVWYHGEKGPQRVTHREGSLLIGLGVVGFLGAFWIGSADGASGASLDDADVLVADLGEGSVAVLPFRSTVEAPELEWLNRALPELLSTHLAQLGDLRVVSGQRIFDLLRQLGVEEGDPVPERIESRLMRLSGASLAVRGSVFGEPGDLTIIATLADAVTGEIQASADARGSDVFDLVDALSARLRARIGGEEFEVQLASSAQLTTPDIEAYRAYEEGRLASLRFDYQGAAEHFGRALEIDTAFALARFRRGLALFRLGRESEATEEVQLARRSLPLLSERDRLLIEGLTGFDQDTTAGIATLRELLGKYPDEKDARIIFAALLAGRRGPDDPEARRLLFESVRLDPSFAAGYNMLAYAYAGVGDLATADSLIDIYVSLEPEQPNPWDSKGEILQLAGRHEEAREAYRQALAIEPDFRFAIDHLIGSYLAEDDPVGAREELRSHLGSTVDEVRIRARALEGDTHLWEGRMDEGLEAFRAAEREAVAADRPDQRAWRLRDLVQTHLALGEFGPAREAAETVRELEPLDGWWITVLYDSLTTLGDVEGMRRWKARVEAQIGGNPLTRSRLPTISTLIDLWIAYGEGRHDRVLTIAAELPESLRRGVVTSWPVYRSMLELGQTDALLDAVRQLQDPNIFRRGPRFVPLSVRWAQYFEARAHEARGDTVAALAMYRVLLEGMGEGVARLPAIADATIRAEALGGPSATPDSVPDPSPR